MLYFLPSFVLAILCGFNPNLEELKDYKGKGKWIFGWLIRSVICFFILLLLFYLGLPAYTGPFYGWGIWLPILLLFGLNCVITMMIKEEWSNVTWVWVVFSFIIIIICCGGSAMFRAADYRDLLGKIEEEKFTDETRPIDIKHIREVSVEQAVKMGGRVLGEVAGAIGSRYKPGEYHIQRVAGELYWVAPLEFQGFFKWWTSETTPGYIMVSAEDMTRKAELHTGYKFKYMTSSFFGDNIHRLLYNKGYISNNLEDFSFELDDNLNPWWVVTVLHPTIQFWGKVIDGIIIVNPETGDMKFYKENEIPDWVDRVYPEKLVEERIIDRGKYVHEFWNSLIQERDVVKPSPYDYGEDVWLTWGDDGQPYWYTGLTSVKQTDQSMVGFIMVNSRTGKAKLFDVSGVSEDGAIQSVEASLGAEAIRWRPTQPILYNVYGTPTFIIPIISQENLFQELAFVNILNSSVVRGNSKSETLQKYRISVLSSGREKIPGIQEGFVVLKDKIVRIARDIQNGTTIYSFTLSNVPGKIFQGTSQISPELPFAEPGDNIEITFFQTDESVVQLQKFDNAAIDLKTSKIQADFDTMRARTAKRLMKN